MSQAPTPTDAFPFWRRNMYAMAMATFCLTLGFGIVNPFLPLVFQEMGVHAHVETWIGYALGGYFGISFFLTPLWGVVADHFGRKLMVLRTSLGMGLLYAALPFTPNLTWFLALFLLMGTTNGFVPSSQALIATNTPSRTMGQSLSLVQTGVLVGGSVGPALGAVLATLLPQYRYLFWVSSVLILFAGLLALVFAQERHDRPQTRFRPHLIQDLRLIWRIPTLKVLYFIQFTYAVTYLGSTAIISVFTLQLLDSQGIHAGPLVDYWVGGVSLAMAVASALAVPLWGRLLDRFGASPILLISLLTATLASLPVIFVQTPLQLAGVRFVLGLLSVGMGPGVVTVVRSRAPQGMESRVLSYGAACGALGIGGGPFIAGQIGPLFGLRAFFALNSLLLAVGVVLWLRAFAWNNRHGFADPVGKG